jgi:hypothetical protein
MFFQLKTEIKKIYASINSLAKVKVDGVECQKRPDCFTHVLEASITKFIAPRKKREIK